MICGSRCIPATSNCCADGASCENGGTCYTKPDGVTACCIPSHTCAAASGSSVIAPAVPTCRGNTPLVCHNQCTSTDKTCCSKGGTCSNGGTCYTTDDGVEACCIPGKSCVASGGLTVIVAATGLAEPSTVTKTKTATATAIMTVDAAEDALLSLSETSFLIATASSSTRATSGSTSPASFSTPIPAALP
jgi:hypothetical protein